MTLKIEVGKTYVDTRGAKVEIIRELNTKFGGDKPFKFLGVGKGIYEFAEQYNESGESATADCDTLIKEYREPVEAEGYVYADFLKGFSKSDYPCVLSVYTHSDNKEFAKVKITEILE